MRALIFVLAWTIALGWLGLAETYLLPLILLALLSLPFVGECLSEYGLWRTMRGTAITVAAITLSMWIGDTSFWIAAWLPILFAALYFGDGGSKTEDASSQPGAGRRPEDVAGVGGFDMDTDGGDGE